MKYTELKIHVSREGVEQITAMMLQMGVEQLSVDDPEDFDDILNKKNEYGWDYIEDELKVNLDREPVVFIYFDCTDDSVKLIADIKQGIEELKKVYQMESLANLLILEVLRSKKVSWMMRIGKINGKNFLSRLKLLIKSWLSLHGRTMKILKGKL